MVLDDLKDVLKEAGDGERADTAFLRGNSGEVGAISHFISEVAL